MVRLVFLYVVLPICFSGGVPGPPRLRAQATNASFLVLRDSCFVCVSSKCGSVRSAQGADACYNCVNTHQWNCPCDVFRCPGGNDACKWCGSAPAPVPPAPPPPSPVPPSPAPSKPAWPTFATQAALQADPWGTYYNMVYGEVPSSAYPISVIDTWMLYDNVVISSKIKTKPNEYPASVGDCPTSNPPQGQHYGYNNKYSMPFLSWIWHPYPYKAVAANTWTEVVHEADPFGDEHYGMWFVNAPGSGIYYYIGKTMSFPEHNDAYTYFKASGNEAVCKAAAAAGLDTLQFLAHVDHVSYQCDTQNTGSAGLNYMNFEIVAVSLVGTYACGSSSGAPAEAFRSGWQASKSCNCDNSKQFLNCGTVGAPQNESSQSMPTSMPTWAPRPPCVAEAIVGDCLVVGCFAGHGQATCQGTSCICDQGYCSTDNWTCVEAIIDNFTMEPSHKHLDLFSSVGMLACAVMCALAALAVVRPQRAVIVVEPLLG